MASLRTTLNEDDEEVLLFSQVLSYDETGQVIREERTQNNLSTVIENEYNLRGELRQSTQTCGNSKVTYLYTTTPWGNKSETILREVNGENVSIESKTFTYNHLNQMEHVIQDNVETTFTYDARGNLIEERIGSQVIKTYTYDVSNRLIKVQDASETQKYTYDGDGNRLTKTIQDTLTEDISHQVYYVNDTSVENERVIQVQDNTENRNVVYGLERIHEAGVLYLSDSYGNIIQHGSKTYAYTPYGELIGGTITGVNEAGYKGEVHDTESLQYLRARTYHTKYQVFLSEDTVVGCDTNPLSQNRYTFALNNPYKYSDPSGNVPQSFDDGNKQANVPGSRQRTIQDEQAFQEAEVELINRYVKPVKGNDYKPDEPITDNSPFYDDLGALQRALNQKTQDSINASKKIASEDSLNPYNYQPNITGGKEEKKSKVVFNHKELTEEDYLKIDKRNIWDNLAIVNSFTGLYLGAVSFISSLLPVGYELLKNPIKVIATGATAIALWLTQSIIINPNMGNDTLRRNLQPISDGGAILGGSGIINQIIESIVDKFNQNKTNETVDDTMNDIDESNKNISDKGKNEVDNVVDDTASQVSGDANALEGGSKVIFESTDDAANLVAKKLDGTLSELKNGYKIEIPNGNKPIVVRIMNEGSGGRPNPYFRVSIDGKGSLTLDGILSNDKGLTHIDMTDDFLNQITDMIEKYQGK